MQAMPTSPARASGQPPGRPRPCRLERRRDRSAIRIARTRRPRRRSACRPRDPVPAPGSCRRRCRRSDPSPKSRHRARGRRGRRRTGAHLGEAEVEKLHRGLRRVILTFVGLRSRWTIPCSCAASRASAIWHARFSPSRTATGPRRQALRQRLALHQFENEEEVAIRSRSRARECAAIRGWLSAGEQPRFTFEASQPVADPRRTARGRIFIATSRLRLDVACPIYLRHAASADQTRRSHSCPGGLRRAPPCRPGLPRGAASKGFHRRPLEERARPLRPAPAAIRVPASARRRRRTPRRRTAGAPRAASRAPRGRSVRPGPRAPSRRDAGRHPGVTARAGASSSRSASP